MELIEVREGNGWCQAKDHQDYANVDRCIYVGEIPICLKCIIETAGGSVIEFFTQEEIDDACSLQHYECSEECCQ